MGQSLANIVVHTVFSTKGRTPSLSLEIQPKLHAYLAGTLQELKAEPIAIGGHLDHVHLLHQLPKQSGVSQVIEEVKKSSSKWMKTYVQDFYWQTGYGSFSVSQEHVPSVVRYIKNQEEHHRNWSFQDELRDLLREHNIAINEQYLWD